MFKRGGSTTGTGIMSHVEPRVNAAFGFPNFGVSQAPVNPTTGMTAYEEMLANRQKSTPSNIEDMFRGMTPRYPSYDTPAQTVEDFYKKRAQSMQDKSGIFSVSPEYKKIITGTKPVSTAMPIDSGDLGSEELNKIASEAAIKSLQNDTPDKDTDTGTKDKPTYKVSDIESEVTKEADFLRKLLEDEQYSRGELALIIAGSLNEPGSIADKIRKAGELGLPIARKRREQDKAITLAAYKAAKEKEKYESRYGQDSDTIRFYKERARSLVGTPGYKDMTQDQIYKELMSGSAEARVNILKSPQTAGEIKNVTDRIARLTTELKTAKPKRKEQIADEILQQKSQLEFLVKMPEFESIYPGVKEILGYKYGGRVMKAIGGDVSDETDMEKSDNTVGMAINKIGEGSGSETVSEGVQRLSYQELRDRLPQEITDDVVNLLANSEEALQEFAYIRTQDDVNSFNTKYGVNLVIPPTRG